MKKYPKKLKTLMRRVARLWRAWHPYHHTVVKGVILVGVIFCIVLYIYAIRSPKNFPVGQLVSIPNDISMGQAARVLKESRVIRSVPMFKIMSRLSSRSGTVIAGDYQFEKRKSLFGVIRAVTQGTFGNVQVNITLPEGSSVRQMAEILAARLPAFNKEEFIVRAEPREGYLFPDTYMFFKSSTTDTVLSTLQLEYEKRIEPFREKIAESQRTEEEIIIMASILEKEAQDGTEAKVIAGILWKRIKIGMPLQVDAPFGYTLGKGSLQLTRDELRADGPYNTYTRKGLPVGPIGNPGSVMIEAALNPIDSPYLFFLHDPLGNIYYARTHDEHVQNKQKYLR